ncbi:MAG TPA: histidine kinase N-terminal 7TM domain-containing protein, partial [Solirubrobacterales bacterium]|nr:histidine kinase N-terminal 7TM domain-containing protein [Solirubrobacterales bacterium]
MSHLDSVSLASIVAATSLVAISSLGLWQERSLLVARSLAALALISAWWTLGRGLATPELSLEHPRLYVNSQVFSGFFGPTLFLFTLAYTGRIERAGRWLLVLVPGALGTVNVLLGACLVPEEVAPGSLEQFYAGVPVHGLEVATTVPWYLPLLVLHTAQLYAFTFASIFVFVRDARRGREPAPGLRHAPARSRLRGAIASLHHRYGRLHRLGGSRAAARSAALRALRVRALLLPAARAAASPPRATVCSPTSPS